MKNSRVPGRLLIFALLLPRLPQAGGEADISVVLKSKLAGPVRHVQHRRARLAVCALRQAVAGQADLVIEPTADEFLLFLVAHQQAKAAGQRAALALLLLLRMQLLGDLAAQAAGGDGFGQQGVQGLLQVFGVAPGLVAGSHAWGFRVRWAGRQAPAGKRAV